MVAQKVNILYITNSLEIVTVKEFLKSANIWCSYIGAYFLHHPVDLLCCSEKSLALKA